MKIRYILSAFLVFASSAVYSNITKTFTIGDDINIREEKLHDATYTRISLKGAQSSGEVGTPEIPVLAYQFYVPLGEVPSEVTVEMKDVKVARLNYRLFLQQAPQPTGNVSSGSATPFAVNDDSMTESEIPQEMEYTLKTKGGAINVVNVYINPFKYDATALKLSYARSFKVNIITKKETSVAKMKIRERDLNNFISNLKRSVTNKEDMEPNLKELIQDRMEKKTTLRVGSQQWNVPFYEYVVITSKDLAPAFEPLVTWKRRKGLNAGIVAIEDILKDPMAADGDVLSEINDDAGKLKAYLQASFDNDGEYVLLGGNDQVVPIRYGYGNRRDHKSDFKYEVTWAGSLEDNIPTDFYFTCVDVDWNKDRDEFYFNTHASANNSEVPEFYIGEKFLKVGRLLCTTQEEISNWITKQLIYEQNPGLGDLSYLGNTLITVADQMMSDKNTVMKNLPEHLKGRIDFIEDENPKECIMPVSPTGNDMVSMMNENKYAFISNSNHGSPTTIALNTYAVNGKCDYDTEQNGVITNCTCPHKDEPYHECNKRLSKFCFTSGRDVDHSDVASGNLLFTIEEKSNSADDLNTEMYKYPFILYSNCCETMPFDEFNRYRKQNQPNLGEALTTKNRTGCVAYLGYTRAGWVGPSIAMEKQFLEQVNLALESEEYIRIAECELNSKINHNNANKSSKYAKWIALAHNLLGCPETNMWMFEPQVYQSPIIKRDGNNVTVSLSDKEIQNLTEVHVTSADDNAISYRQSLTIDSDHKSVTFEDVPENYYVVITQPRHLPYIYSSKVNGCIIQDEIFTEDRGFICDKIKAGEKVTDEKAYGKVIVKEGAKLYLESLEKTELKGGFQVELGGSLEVR